MSLLQEIVFVANNSKALKDIKQIETEVKRIQSLGESAIKIDIDKNGIASVFSQLKSDTGAVVNLVRQLNAETGQLEEKSSSVSINYDKIAKNNAKIEAEAKRLLAQEDELARKTAEREEKERQIAELRARQASHSKRQRELELTFGNYDDYIKSLNLTEEQLEKMGLASDDAKKKTGQLGDQAQKTGGQFTLVNTILIRLAHTALTALTRAFREALTEMKNVDTQLTTISRITQTNISDLDSLKNKAYDVGNQYGVLASDYLSAAAAFTRAGYREQAEDLAELSSKMQIAGQVSAETANQLLIATDKAYGFNGSVTELSAVMDKMTVIDHNYATSVEKIAEGIGLVAPIASQAHMSMDELIAAMGTITAVTQRSGSESARALRALILSIIKDTTTEIEEGVTWTVEEINTLQDALKTYAPTVVAAAEATGTLIDPMEAIAALSKAYEEGLLTETKLADITSKLGGKLRASQLLSLIQNYSGMYTQMMSDMGNAIGAVDKDVDKALQSWEVKLNQLKNTFTKFVQDSLDTNFIKGLIDAVNFLVSGFGNLGTALGVVAGAFVALNITSIVGWFTNLGKSVRALGGGFTNLILVLTNYKTASKAGAVGTKDFNTALEGASLSASLAQIAISGLTAVIAGFIIIWNKYKQHLGDKVAGGTTALQSIESLDELREKYDTLQEQYKKGEITEEQYAQGKDSVIKKLDEEGVWVDSVTSKYETLDERIRGAIDTAKEYKEVEVYDALTALREESGFKENQRYAGKAAKYFGMEHGYDPNRDPWEADIYSLEELVELYDKAMDRKAELYGNKGTGSKEYNTLTNFTDSVKDLVEAYKKLKGAIDGTEDSTEVAEDTVVVATKDIGDSVEGLSQKLDKAVESLDKYKKALSDGEKGDTFKSMADAYKKAIEMLDKGLTGTNAYTAAVDLLFSKDQLREWGYDYEQAGEYLRSQLFQSMFGGEGKDFASGFANYIRDNKEAYKDFVDVIEQGDGKFGLFVKDVQGLSDVTGLSKDAIWAAVDALDAYDSALTYTRGELLDLLGVSQDWSGTVNLTAFINDLINDGKTEREIYQIVEAFRKLAETDPSIELEEPENLQETIDSLMQINDEAKDDKTVDVVVVSNSKEAFDEIRGEISQLNGSTIYIGVRYVEENSPSGGTKDGTRSKSGGSGGRYTYATGTDSARGGLSLVNDGNGAELISANGRAWIAGGGEPVITNLPIGARVFSADETREILSRSGINAFEGGSGDSTSVDGIPYDKDKKNTGKKPPKNLDKILDELSKYIDKILKKAKEALDAQLKAIDAQIDALQREHDAAEDANKLEELRLNILEAEKKLEEAQNERTVRYFNKETGQWEWMADQKAVYDAEQALKEAQEAYDKEVAEQAYQAQIQSLNDLKDTLQDQYDQLADHWDEIVNAIKESTEKEIDFENLIKKLGLDGSTSGSIRDLIQAIQDYEKKLADGTYEIPLDSATTSRILGMTMSAGSGSATLAQVLGISNADANAKGTSMYSTSTSTVGGSINYYINGIHIGSDMMNMTLSEILSVLPIYAN